VDLKDRLSSNAFPWRDALRRHRAWLLVGLGRPVYAGCPGAPARHAARARRGEYAYAGQLILQGVPPYKEAYNMKLPGTYAAYAAIMAVFGQSPSGIRLGLALVNAASIVLVFRLGRRLLDDAAGVAAAVAFTLLSLSPRCWAWRPMRPILSSWPRWAGRSPCCARARLPSKVRHHVSRFSFHASRITHHASRIPPPALNPPLSTIRCCSPASCSGWRF